jgi:D-glycero-alpha-D-manno-heptose-7-phosphate kinase|tara:strand:- start:1069 stop:1986 length:918 start_codon:yes stop_codon:yes gene_type:complete
MIFAKCPLRVSLAGGSTDLQDFIDSNGYGGVISFPSTLYTYITVHKNNTDKYIVNYSEREEVKDVTDIRNDIAREVMKRFPTDPITMTFNTDSASQGTGLASSSSYTVAAVAAMAKLCNKEMSTFDIVKLALDIERTFNRYTGYQDPYGCGLGSFKKLEFYKDEDPKVCYLSSEMFSNFDMHLLYTGVVRESTTVLEKVIKSDRMGILDIMLLMDRSINDNDFEEFINLVGLGWESKKKSLPQMLGDNMLKNIDNRLSKDSNILAHRLCGAGNGGYFLILSKKGYTPAGTIPISIDNQGVQAYEV